MQASKEGILPLYKTDHAYYDIWYFSREPGKGLLIIHKKKNNNNNECKYRGIVDVSILFLSYIH